MHQDKPGKLFVSCLSSTVPVCLAILTFFTHPASTASVDVGESDSDFSLVSSGTVILAAAISTLALILVLAVALFNCMDCMNSEVSSEMHPACGDSSRKWGGAVNYTPANRNDPSAGYTSGEVVRPSADQQLPYSMVPTQVPEEAGFRGYGSQATAGGDAPPPPTSMGYGGGQGLLGYGAGNSGLSGFTTLATAPPQGQGGSSQGSGGPGISNSRHYDPMDPHNDPPPAYSATGF